MNTTIAILCFVTGAVTPCVLYFAWIAIHERQTFVTVAKGEFITYDCTLGTENIRGGWIKASDGKKTKVSLHVCVLAIAKEDFSYDPRYGAAYHKIRHQRCKVFSLDPGRDQVVGPTYLVDD